MSIFLAVNLLGSASKETDVPRTQVKLSLLGNSLFVYLETENLY